MYPPLQRASRRYSTRFDAAFLARVDQSSSNSRLARSAIILCLADVASSSRPRVPVPRRVGEDFADVAPDFSRDRRSGEGGLRSSSPSLSELDDDRHLSRARASAMASA